MLGFSQPPERGAALHLFSFWTIEAFRICADYPMYSLAHLIGGTIIIDASLSLYRLHGRNGYRNLPCMGGQVSRMADHGAMNRRLAPHMLRKPLRLTLSWEGE